MTATTTADEVYRRVRDLIGEALDAEGLSTGLVSLVEEPNLDLASSFFIQVRPAGGVLGFSRAGQSLVDDQIEVTTWIRSSRDPAGKDDHRLAADGEGVLSRTALVRGVLQNSTLDDLLAVPLRQIRTSAPRKSTRAPNYVSVTDVFACSYDVAAGRVFLGWSATPPVSVTAMSGAQVEAATSISRDEGGEKYLWCLSPQSLGDLFFWHEGGRGVWYSDENEPPSGPSCGTVTISGVVYRRFRSPYPTHGQSATYRVRRS